MSKLIHHQYFQLHGRKLVQIRRIMIYDLIYIFICSNFITTLFLLIHFHLYSFSFFVSFGYKTIFNTSFKFFFFNFYLVVHFKENYFKKNDIIARTRTRTNKIFNTYQCRTLLFYRRDLGDQSFPTLLYFFFHFDLRKFYVIVHDEFAKNFNKLDDIGHYLRAFYEFQNKNKGIFSIFCGGSINITCDAFAPETPP